MILPSDQLYKQSKLIKLGKNKVKQEYLAIIDWINFKYNVNVLNILLDYVIVAKEKLPR